MSTIDTSGFYSMYGIKNTGVGGLATGLNTDEIVQSLLTGTRNKIAKQQIQKQTLKWQQTAYRNVATMLDSFKTKYLTIGNSSTTQIGTSAFFQTYKGTSSSSKVTFDNANSTAGGTVKIDQILQTATAETITTKNDGKFANSIGSESVDLESNAYAGKTLKLTVTDGSGALKSYTVKLDELDSIVRGPSESAEDYAERFQAKLQELVNGTVGTRTKVDTNGEVVYQKDAFDNFILDAKGNKIPEKEAIVDVEIGLELESDGVTHTGKYSVTVGGDTRSKVTAGAACAELGVAAAQSNRLDTGGTPISDLFGLNRGDEFTFTVNGKEFTVKGTDSVSTVMTKINSSAANVRVAYDNTIGQFVFTSSVTGSGQNIQIEDVDGNLMEKWIGAGLADPSGVVTRQEGTNAEIVVGGEVHYSKTNSFNIGGVAFTVNDVTEAGESITVSSSSDPDELMDKIKSFIDDYNALVISLNTLLYESPNRDYTALSDEQKAGMTDEQIKNWETEAKKGLLYNDSTIRSILSELRGVMNQKVEFAGLSLYDIGISTPSLLDDAGDFSMDLKTSGTLKVNEDRLRAAIEQNPEGVKSLFIYNGSDKTNEKGIAYALSDVITKATHTTSIPEERGTLVRIAGADRLTGDNTSVIGDKLDRIDKYITTLKTRMQAEYTRYWNKFSALETAISKMNTQSSWFSEM